MAGAEVSAETAATWLAKPKSMQEYQDVVLSAEREIKKIKAVESELKWDMVRQDKRQAHSREAATESEIRNYRWRQNEEMKALVAEKAHKTKLQSHTDEVDRNGFKKENRARSREADNSFERERQAWNKENSQWQAELTNEVRSGDQEVAGRVRQDVRSRREVRRSLRQQSKTEEEKSRAFERGLEMAHKIRELSRQRESAMHSLQQTRSCCEVSPLRGASRTASPQAVRLRRMSGRQLSP